MRATFAEERAVGDKNPKNAQKSKKQKEAKKESAKKK
jgi:hypothetical protein